MKITPRSTIQGTFQTKNLSMAEMQIHRSSPNIGMPKQIFNLQNVGSTVKKMGSKAGLRV
jgi:hypothetical protein